jgi:hypothetical protein
LEEVASFYCLGQISKNPQLVINRYVPSFSNNYDKLTYLKPVPGTQTYETSDAVTLKAVSAGVNGYFSVDYLLKKGRIHSKLNFAEHLT